MNEINRVIRHGVAPLTAYLVATGRIPAYMQGDVTEGLVLLAGLVAPVIVSHLRDRKRGGARRVRG